MKPAPARSVRSEARNSYFKVVLDDPSLEWLHRIDLEFASAIDDGVASADDTAEAPSAAFAKENADRDAGAALRRYPLPPPLPLPAAGAPLSTAPVDDDAGKTGDEICVPPGSTPPPPPPLRPRARVRPRALASLHMTLFFGGEAQGLLPPDEIGLHQLARCGFTQALAPPPGGSQLTPPVGIATPEASCEGNIERYARQKRRLRQ